MNLFIYADIESKIKRCQSRQEGNEVISPKLFKKQIKKVDQQRARNRAVLTDTKWGDKAAFHLCINTSDTEIKTLIPAIVEFQKCFFQEVNHEHPVI